MPCAKRTLLTLTLLWRLLRLLPRRLLLFFLINQLHQAIIFISSSCCCCRCATNGSSASRAGGRARSLCRIHQQAHQLIIHLCSAARDRESHVTH